MSKSKPKDTVTCPDCGAEYDRGAMHNMFCKAKACSECGTSFGYKLPVYDSRPESADEDGDPIRLCEECLEERLDQDEEDTI